MPSYRTTGIQKAEKSPSHVLMTDKKGLVERGSPGDGLCPVLHAERRSLSPSGPRAPPSPPLPPPPPWTFFLNTRRALTVTRPESSLNLNVFFTEPQW